MKAILFLTNKLEEGPDFCHALEAYAKFYQYKLYPLVLSVNQCDLNDFHALLDEFITSSHTVIVLYSGESTTSMKVNRGIPNARKVAFEELASHIRDRFLGAKADLHVLRSPRALFDHLNVQGHGTK